MIRSSTSGAGLYFASSRRSLDHEGSSAGYGRYSSTSRAQRLAFEIPAASNACCISAMVAVFALTFGDALAVAEAGQAADAEAGEAAPCGAADCGTFGADVALVPDPGAHAAPRIMNVAPRKISK